MGVSLERVQFKFASIVGELCSEPDTLSQFAVWLDLRLAEYKLKGAISLDCSGDEPEATWMRGLSKCKRCASNPQPTQQYTPQSPSQVEVSQYSEQVFSSNERISPDIVVVKNEEDVVPVELHTSQGVETSSKQLFQRKRTAQPSDNWQNDFISSPSKQRRMWSTADSPSNQSLMSVIGSYRDETPETFAKGKNSSSVIEKEDGNLSYTDGAIHSPSYNDDEKPSTSLDTSAWAHQANSDTLNSTLNMQVKEEAVLRHSYGEDEDIKEELQDKYSSFLVPAPLRRPDPRFPYSVACVKFRIAQLGDVSDIPKKSVTNMVGAVGCFERWLWEGPYNDKRLIAEIPPEELDPYLAEFFPNVKTVGKSAYTPDSFVAFRSYISRYLRHCGYRELIGSSPKFYESQQVFKKQRLLLQKQMCETKSPLTK